MYKGPVAGRSHVLEDRKATGGWGVGSKAVGQVGLPGRAHGLGVCTFQTFPRALLLLCAL